MGMKTVPSREVNRTSLALLRNAASSAVSILAEAQPRLLSRRLIAMVIRQRGWDMRSPSSPDIV